jgi:hypothetical protein
MIKGLPNWLEYILIALGVILLAIALIIIFDPGISLYSNKKVLPDIGDAFNILGVGVSIAALMAFLRTISQQRELIEQNAKMIQIQKEEHQKTNIAHNKMLKLKYIKEILGKLKERKLSWVEKKAAYLAEGRDLENKVDESLKSEDIYELMRQYKLAYTRADNLNEVIDELNNKIQFFENEFEALVFFNIEESKDDADHSRALRNSYLNNLEKFLDKEFSSFR